MAAPRLLGLSPCALSKSNLIGSLSSSKRIVLAASVGVEVTFSCPALEFLKGSAMFVVLLWFSPSESARLMGLFGEVLRGTAFKGALLRTMNLGFALLESGPVSAL